MGKGRTNKSLKLRGLINKESLLCFKQVIVEWGRVEYGILKTNENKFNKLEEIDGIKKDSSQGWYFIPNKDMAPLRLFIKEINFPVKENPGNIEVIINPKTIKSEKYGIHQDYLNKYQEISPKGRIINLRK